MLSAKLKHSSDRTLWSVISLFQAILWLVVTVLFWMDNFNNEATKLVSPIHIWLITVFAVVWVLFSGVFLYALFKSDGPECGKICFGRMILENRKAFLPLILLAVGSTIVTIGHVLLFSKGSFNTGTFEKTFAEASLTAYVALYAVLTLTLIGRAALK